MQPDISARRRVYYLANSAKEFCPTCKPVLEWLFDETFPPVFAADKTLATKVKNVWTDSPIRQRFA
jgi:hypothetical protein